MTDVRDTLKSEQINEIFEFTTAFSTEAGHLVREMVKEKFSKEEKRDKSFVTAVDLKVEDLLREKVAELFPEHGIVGEERAGVNPGAEFQWIIDPIDGTQNLVHGIPTYGIVVGCFYKDRPIAGAINHPVMKLEYYGAYKRGAFRDGERLHIQDNPEQDEFRQEVIALSTRACFKRIDREDIYDKVVRAHDSTRVYYDIFSTTRAIEGQVGALLEFGMKCWDIAATEILVTEAGGVYEEFSRVNKAGSPEIISIIIGKPSVVARVKEMIKE
jgi:fructose-1,6-bisphosphatase/inositol monophosphatase family enzyme